MKKLLLILVILFMPCICFAKPNKDWTKLVGGRALDILGVFADDASSFNQSITKLAHQKSSTNSATYYGILKIGDTDLNLEYEFLDVTETGGRMKSIVNGNVESVSDFTWEGGFIINKEEMYKEGYDYTYHE